MEILRRGPTTVLTDWDMAIRCRLYFGQCRRKCATVSTATLQEHKADGTQLMEARNALSGVQPSRRPCQTDRWARGVPLRGGVARIMVG